MMLIVGVACEISACAVLHHSAAMERKLHGRETKSEGRCRDEAKDYTDRDTIVITYKGFI